MTVLAYPNSMVTRFKETGRSSHLACSSHPTANSEGPAAGCCVVFAPKARFIDNAGGRRLNGGRFVVWRSEHKRLKEELGG